MRILIIEDDDTDFYFLKNSFGKYDYEIIRAKNVEDTFCKMRETIPDLIILDIRLQIKHSQHYDLEGGINILERLEIEGLLEKIPCFITSVYYDDENIKKNLLKYEKYGIRIYKKPFRVRELAKEVKKLFDENR